MNLTRRHLFRALSSVALAPLVKLVPKEKPHVQFQSFVGPSDTDQLITTVPEWADVSVSVFYKRDSNDSFAKAKLVVDCLRSEWGYRPPVPQEEG